MIPWELLASAPVAGGTELRLMRRGTEYSIRSGAREVMNSRAHGSEEALAELACKDLSAAKAPRVLVGGLGMGYTLAAALRFLPFGAKVVVAELVPAVLEWNRGVLGALAGHPLRDPRVSAKACDVAALLEESPSAFDAILLDVDNGPAALVSRSNDALYSRAGLAAARVALRPGGRLAVWSAAPDRAFVHRLGAVGLLVEESRVPPRGPGHGGWHTIWIARRTSVPGAGKPRR